MGIFDPLKVNLKLYWSIFGGLKALIASPNIYLALGLAILSIPYVSDSWFDLPISIIPDILGFTLGGYAVLLSFGGESFYKTMCIRLEEDGDEPTPYMTFNGAFVHFIVVQIITLIYALIGKALDFHSVLGMIGVFLMYYTILTSLAAVFAIMNLAASYEKLTNHEINKKE